MTAPTDTTTVPENAVSVSRRISAPAPRIFSLLADPASHPRIDGSGMLRGAIDPRPLRAIGDEFVMAMHNDEMGDYEMTNVVVEFDSDRAIVWEPRLSGATRPEDVAEIGNSAHQRWGFRLVGAEEGATLVTETFDCSGSPEWLKKAVRGGQRWVESMTLTLERLESAVSAG
jgi:uncharacterized protein YndB with AHSA1/START domain